MRERFYIGLDLGRKQDPTAVAVVERREVVSRELDPVTRAFPRRILTVARHLERLELGMSYEEVVERVKALMRRAEMKGDKTLVVDASGVGLPVVELLTRGGLGCEVVAVTITGGAQGRWNGEGYNVPRRDLMDGLRVMAAAGEILVARGVWEGEVLVEELLGLDEEGRSRGHDDLVMALALACWRVRGWFDPCGKTPLGIEPGRG